jgi:uncharacterized protein (DUF488 family)
MIHTFGHSNHSFDYFLKHLEDCQIDILVDVRSKPYSRWKPHFSRSQLENLLRDHGIKYLWGGRFLGGLGSTSVESRIFQIKMNNVIELAQDNNVVLMCAEKDPATCHRATKLTAWLHRNTDMTAEHILEGGELVNSRVFEPSILPEKMWHEFGGEYGKSGGKDNKPGAEG